MKNCPFCQQTLFDDFEEKTKHTLTNFGRYTPAGCFTEIATYHIQCNNDNCTPFFCGRVDNTRGGMKGKIPDDSYRWYAIAMSKYVVFHMSHDNSVFVYNVTKEHPVLRQDEEPLFVIQDMDLPTFLQLTDDKITKLMGQN